MAKFIPSPWVNIKISVAIITLFSICITVLMPSQLEHRGRRDILASTEIPVEYIDPASIDLTSLVNTLIDATYTGSQHLFSVLSVMSHSSLALHKLTLLVYNISNFQDIENTMFPTKYCYCVTNKTNDLTDFTAILLDVMGNSTTYLQELFKSSSILSVTQRNGTECIYICVMAGKTDRDLLQLWDSVPLFNQTISEDTHRVSSAGSPTLAATPTAISVPWQPPAVTMTTTPTAVAIESEHSAVFPTTDSSSGYMATTPTAVFSTAVPSTTATAQSSVTIRPTSVTITTSDTASMTQLTSLVTARLGVLPTVTTKISIPMMTDPLTTSVNTVFSPATRQTAPTLVSTTPKSSAVPRTTNPAIIPYKDKAGCPWRSELLRKESEREGVKDSLEEDLSEHSPTVSAMKLQPCVFELCKFFSQCLCRGISYTQQRYCIDSHFWYVKHTVELCSRMRRVAFSKNLKQRCLARICVKM